MMKEKGVADFSKFIRQLLINEVHDELPAEEKLECELQQLQEEMKSLQKHHKTLLAHGTYAKDYLMKLKDGITVTHKPFNYSKAQIPNISPEEMELVVETVQQREDLAKKYREKLRELLKLKREKHGTLTPNKKQA
jgi:hypothetical protein